MSGKWSLVLLCSVLAGCAPSEQILLTAAADQQAIVRDGIPALVSQKKHLVMLRPNTRMLKSGTRPAFTLAVLNQGATSETLLEASISASQVVGQKPIAVRIYRYDELVQEEEARQAIAAFSTALSAMGRSMSAANAGYTNTTGTFRTYGSTYGTTQGTYSATSYDPSRTQIAQHAANAQTDREVAALRAQGKYNLESLQQTILKDHTILPGEWHGGSIVLAAPEMSGDGGTAEYSITVYFAAEQHTFAVSHVAR